MSITWMYYFKPGVRGKWKDAVPNDPQSRESVISHLKSLAAMGTWELSVVDHKLGLGILIEGKAGIWALYVAVIS
jgi:hypothetical protein